MLCLVLQAKHFNASLVCWPKTKKQKHALLMRLQSKWQRQGWEKTTKKPGDIMHFILSLDGLCCTLKSEAL